MEIKNETAETLRTKRSLYGAIFNRYGDLLRVEEGGVMRLPGGKVYLADVSQYFDERWIPDFLSRKIETDTGIPFPLTREIIQPIPAMYNVYSFNFKEEHSVIIVGIVDAEKVTEENTSFFEINKLFDFDEKGIISRAQKLLALRAFASRDCPNKDYRKIAGAALKKIHTS